MMRLLRLPFWAYFIAAPLVLIFAIFMFIDDQTTETGKARARAGAAPGVIAIEKFDPARNMGPANEVQIVGQVDVSRMMELTESKRGIERGRWIVAPIYAADAKDNTGPALGVFEQRGAISDKQMAGMIVANGAFGPVMRIHGAVTPGGADDKAVRKGLEQVALSPNVVVVDPFENGRDIALAPSDEGRNIALGIAAIALLIAGYGWFLMNRQRRRDTEPAYAAEAA